MLKFIPAFTSDLVLYWIEIVFTWIQIFEHCYMVWRIPARSFQHLLLMPFYRAIQTSSNSFDPNMVAFLWYACHFVKSPFSFHSSIFQTLLCFCRIHYTNQAEFLLFHIHQKWFRDLYQQRMQCFLLGRPMSLGPKYHKPNFLVLKRTFCHIFGLSYSSWLSVTTFFHQRFELEAVGSISSWWNFEVHMQILIDHPWYRDLRFSFHLLVSDFSLSAVYVTSSSRVFASKMNHSFPFQSLCWCLCLYLAWGHRPGPMFCCCFPGVLMLLQSFCFWLN